MFGARLMRINPQFKALFALLLVVMLPLRGYAAMTHCASAHDGAAAAAQTTHCADRGGAARLHACGDCCCVTAALPPPADWSLTRVPAPVISPRLLSPPRALAKDRLDRPPRPAAVA
jgi:hypothetical protein